MCVLVNMEFGKCVINQQNWTISSRRASAISREFQKLETLFDAKVVKTGVEKCVDKTAPVTHNVVVAVAEPAVVVVFFVGEWR